MTSKLTALSAKQVQSRLSGRTAILIDVREADEYRRKHIAGSSSQPLSGWDKAQLAIEPHVDVIFSCRSGMRVDSACDRLAAKVAGNAYTLAGGIEAWGKAGFALESDPSAPLEIMRQVQIAAGSLTLIGIALGFFVAPGFFAISAFVGAGLTFAGISGFCGMARLMALAPWNRAASA